MLGDEAHHVKDPHHQGLIKLHLPGKNPKGHVIHKSEIECVMVDPLSDFGHPKGNMLESLKVKVTHHYWIFILNNA